MTNKELLSKSVIEMTHDELMLAAIMAKNFFAMYAQSEKLTDDDKLEMWRGKGVSDVADVLIRRNLV